MTGWRTAGERPGFSSDEAAGAGAPDSLAGTGEEGDDADAGLAPARPRVRKAAGAFRTISEVADELHIPQHVLRFWETRFPQVKPLKRGGGRRYYRPDDIALLRRISDLLYIQGYTIKGVQRLLREGGGRLADDIPPAPEAERAAAEAERHLPEPPLQLLIPDLPPAAARRPTHVGPTEVERLRTALTHALAQLEAMRAMLP